MSSIKTVPSDEFTFSDKVIVSIILIGIILFIGGLFWSMWVSGIPKSVAYNSANVERFSDITAYGDIINDGQLYQSDKEIEILLNGSYLCRYKFIRVEQTKKGIVASLLEKNYKATVTNITEACA